MPATSYFYDVASAMPLGMVNVQNLIGEIQASAIVTALDRIDTSGGVTVDGVQTGGDFTIWFKDALSPGDKFLLDADQNAPAGGVVGSNDTSPTPPVAQVEVTNHRTREDGVLYAVPKPSSFGLFMCDRDLRVNTCVVDNDASLQDLKINTTTNKEEDWNELQLVGVFKNAGGVMVACANQADADANGVLSIWDYQANVGGVPILYEVRDGLLYVDPALPPAEAWDHRAYAVIAPAVPAVMGGSVAVFDAYLAHNPDNTVAALSPQAQVLDPAGPAGPAGSVIRLYVVHPAGSKLSHVLRLVTYRAPGTF